jgi:hypothetical protein
LLTGRHILVAASVAIAAVFGLASWRHFNGETEQVHAARPATPVVAKPAAPAVAASEASASINQVEMTQQILVDDFQLLQGRVAKQDAEIRRLRAELEGLSQKYDALSSFASTPRESKPLAEAEPPKKKKKKRIVKRSPPKKRA